MIEKNNKGSDFMKVDTLKILSLKKTHELLNIGKEKIDKKDFSNAVTFFNHLIMIKPSCADAYYYCGYAQFKLHNYNQALENLLKASDLGFKHSKIHYSSEDLNFLISVGNEMIIENKFTDAITFFDCLINLVPELPEAHYYCGYAYFWLNNDTQALQAFKKAIELGLKQVTIRHYPTLQFQPEKLDYMLTELESIIKRRPRHPYPHYLCGIIYLWKNNTDKAAQHFHQSQELALPNEEDYIDRGITRLSADDLIGFLTINNNQETKLMCAGRLALNNDILAVSHITFDCVLTQNPYQDQAYSYLALLSLARKEYALAFEQFNKSISLNQSAANYYRRGYGFLSMAKADYALTDFITAFLKEPDNEQTYLNLVGFFLNEDLSTLSKTFIFDQLNRLPLNEKIFFFNSALDIETTLGKRFWMQEGSHPCRLDRGTLGMIRDYLIKNDPCFSDPLSSSNQISSPITSLMQFFQPIKNLIYTEKSQIHPSNKFTE